MFLIEVKQVKSVQCFALPFLFNKIKKEIIFLDFYFLKFVPGNSSNPVSQGALTIASDANQYKSPFDSALLKMKKKICNKHFSKFL